MNIGIVCYPTYGGSGVVATELGIALAEKNHKVHFISYTQPARIDVLSANLFYHEVTFKDYPLFDHAPYVLALASKLVDVVLHEKLDVLHVHYAIPHAAAANMAKQILESKGIKIPVVTTLHGTDITLVGKDPSYQPVVEFNINQSDAVTTVSESLKKDTLNSFDIKRDINVIPNFIDLDKIQRSKKDHFKTAICPNGEKLLVHISNFRKVKRVDLVVKVFNEVRKVTPAKLLLIGDGPERPAIEKLCRELGTCDDIRFLGKLTAIDEVLSISDVFLMPSESESFGLAALEAMACEVPVVSSNIGGIPEVNTHGITGLLSDVGDIDTMVNNTLEVLDEKNHSRYKKAAYQRAKEFDINLILPQYLEVYERVLK